MQPTFTLPAWRLMREPEVCAAVGFSRSTIRRLAKAGEFPQYIKVGSGQGGAVAWRADDVLAWVETRQAGRPWTPAPAPKATGRAAA